MSVGKRIILDPRLSMIASLVGRCERIADIGCDHGRLGAFLLQTGQCRRAVLTDISEPSLKKARALIALLGFSEQVEFRVGDGALALDSPVDAAVIAGMGGAAIAGIVRAGRARLGNARLVLQPNVAAAELRKALSECGYRIVDERVARDNRRNYVVIAAEPGHSDYSQEQLVVGPVLLERLPPELLSLAQFRLRVARKALLGSQSGGDAAQSQALAREIEIWEAVEACLQRLNRS